MQSGRCVTAVLVGLLLSGCAALDGLQGVQPLDYQCPRDLRFTAYLYRDIAMLDGARGHAVLQREMPGADAGATGAAASAPLRYADASVRAEFGLGEQGRLARLDYANIPEPIYCTRIAAPGSPVEPPRAVNRDGPRPPPPPPDPDAPGTTNLRTSDGQPVRAG